MTTQLLALAASTRKGSYNQQLITIAARKAEAVGARVTVLDYAELASPVFTDESSSELPQGAKTLADALLAHDGLLLASPEYNWSMPGSLKNLIDWLSVDARAPLAGKTCFLMCASPSSRGGVIGLTQLRVPLEVLHMWVYPQILGIGNCAESMKDAGFVRAKDTDFLRTHMTQFIEATSRLSPRA